MPQLISGKPDYGMVLQIRGANGSGKSTIVRNFMRQVGDDWKAHIVEGRKRPLYYRHERKKIVVLGHYEIDCGGCDTLSGNEATFKLQQELSKSYRVLAEGIMLSEDVKWSSQLENLKILFLDTPLETCLERVKNRREESGREHKEPFDPTRTIRRFKDFIRIRQRLKKAKIDVVECGPEEALKILTEQFGV